MAIKCRNYHFCLSRLFHLSSMGKNMFGQRCTDNGGSTSHDWGKGGMFGGLLWVA